jgi:6-pyruvoyltetrahydropterin/6-carboxytetrahydropterin synthase
MKVGRLYTFQSSHRLPHVLPGHKCGRLHGHTYSLEVEIVGKSEPTMGWLMDFAMLDAIVEGVIVSKLDHYHLNDVPGLENPTSENIVDWIWDRLSIYGWPSNVNLHRVRVSENGRSWASREPYER